MSERRHYETEAALCATLLWRAAAVGVLNTSTGALC